MKPTYNASKDQRAWAQMYARFSDGELLEEQTRANREFTDSHEGHSWVNTLHAAVIMRGLEPMDSCGICESIFNERGRVFEAWLTRYPNGCNIAHGMFCETHQEPVEKGILTCKRVDT